MAAPAASGVFAAALTPLHENLSPDHGLFARHCRWLLDNGCDGLSILGTTGEANSFSREERIEILDRLVAAGIPAGRLMPGTGCCAIPDTVTLSQGVQLLEVSSAVTIAYVTFYGPCYYIVDDLGFSFGATPTEAASWGAVKATYR